jgi:hypothetical protein
MKLTADEQRYQVMQQIRRRRYSECIALAPDTAHRPKQEDSSDAASENRLR